MKWYRTEWTQSVLKRRGPKAGKTVRERRCYETKSLTDVHLQIRSQNRGAITMLCDDSVKFPFGVFAEVVARSPV